MSSDKKAAESKFPICLVNFLTLDDELKKWDF